MNSPNIFKIDVLNILRPKPCPFPLIRIGGNKDGAYLLPDDLRGIKACFSPGVNNFKNFEDELLEKFGIVSHMCDYSSDLEKFKTPLKPGQTFKKKWLDVDGNDKSISLFNWVNQLEPNSNDDLILQMDIEGAEYRNLINTPTTILQRFRIIVIELHGLGVINQPEKFEKELAPLLTLLDQYFTCVHAHPNNCCGEIILSEFGLNLPIVHELTFLRKDRWNGVQQSDCYVPLLPHPLDIPHNVTKNPPLFLNEHWLESGERAPESKIKMLNDKIAYLERELQGAKLVDKSQANASVLLDLHRLAQYAAAAKPINRSKPTDLNELAEGKKFSLSSVHIACPSERVVREKVPFFFHTNHGRNEHITIDLEQEYHLFELHIINRLDSCKERASCLFYCVHNTSKPNLSAALAVVIDDSFLTYTGSRSVTNLDGCYGRYLTVFSPEETYLHFSSLKIFGL